MWKQFPLQLACVITINRSQGQELDRTLLDLRDHALSHGQRYVALSRVRRRQGIAALINSEAELVDGNPAAINIVYPKTPIGIVI